MLDPGWSSPMSWLLERKEVQLLENWTHNQSTYLRDTDQARGSTPSDLARWLPGSRARLCLHNLVSDSLDMELPVDLVDFYLLARGRFVSNSAGQCSGCKMDRHDR